MRLVQPARRLPSYVPTTTCAFQPALCLFLSSASAQTNTAWDSGTGKLVMMPPSVAQGGPERKFQRLHRRGQSVEFGRQNKESPMSSKRLKNRENRGILSRLLAATFAILALSFFDATSGFSACDTSKASEEGPSRSGARPSAISNSSPATKRAALTLPSR